MSERTVEEIQAALAMPFPAERIEWRIQQSGFKGGKPWAMVLAYMDARAVQDRLDAVCGIAGWRNEFSELTNGATLCGISIKINGEWITKWNGAGDTAVEKEKGALSGAVKRAAVEWGIGRYLYDLPVGWANFVDDRNKAKHNCKINVDGKPQWFYWNPPELPKWALPG